MKYTSTIENQLEKKNHSDAGFDIRSAEAVIIPAHERRLIRTGLHVEIDEGYVGIVKPRSGLAVGFGIDVMAGVIDADYRGEVQVLLYNTSNKDFSVINGDRIAQLVVVPCILDAEKVDSLSDTKRGSDGFGSTGVK